MRGRQYSIIWLITVLLSPSLPAQSPVPVDLDQELDRIELLSTTDLDEVRRQLEMFFDRETELTSDQRARIYLLRGFVDHIHNQPEQALNDLRTVLEMPSIRNEYRARAWSHTSQIMAQQGQHSAAFESIFRALELLPDVREEKYIFGTLHSAANLHNDVEAYVEATQYARRAVDFARQSNNQRYLCFGLQALAASQVHIIEQADATQATLTEGLDSCTSIGEALVRRNLMLLSGLVAIRQGEHSDAIDMLTEALELADQTTVPEDVVHIRTLLARANLELGNMNQARSLAEQSLEAAIELGDKRRERDANAILASYMNQQGDHRQAYVYSQNYIAINQAIQGDIKTRQYAFLVTKYETLDKNFQISRLDQQNKLLELEREIAEKSRFNLQLMLVLIFAVLAFAIMWLVKVQRQKHSLKQLAEVDSLTGIFNRRQILKMAEQLFQAYREDGRSFNVVLMDLDKFKSINDDYGHATGDWTLKAVTSTIKNTIRSSDFFGRTGGEEFVILFPEMGSRPAVELADRCRLAIQQIDSSPTGNSFNVTASFGISSSDPADKNVSAVLNRADIALYKAKSAGRNQVVYISRRETEKPTVERLEVLDEDDIGQTGS